MTPDWMDVLKDECAKTSQRRVASVLGYSAATVNLVLADKYTGDMARFEQAVRGAFMGDTVGCPLLGTIPQNECLSHQREKFNPTNTSRVQQYKACKSCPHKEN